jgi:DNA-binding transcriptional ArsR family regulator
VDDVVLRSPAQFKALGHPLRHRLLNVVRERPATLSQLAATLGSTKGTIGYHVRVLVDAGLLRPSGRRTVRGGTEQYFEPVGGAFVHDAPGTEGAEFLFRAALAEMVAPAGDEVEHTMLRHVRLTAAQARALVDRIEKLGHEKLGHEKLGRERDNARAYGLLLSVFRADIPPLSPGATVAP